MKCESKTEEDMRDKEEPNPKTEDDLAEYIRSLLKREHSYGTCVYAMSLAATATFNYVANVLGVTRFQASCADMDFLRRSRRYKGPFMITDVSNALYPQYDLVGDLEEYIDRSRDWLRDQARKNLQERELYVSPKVKEHWERLAK